MKRGCVFDAMNSCIVMKLFIICTFLLLITIGHTITVETASLNAFMYGNTEATAYDNWISHVVEGLARPGYNVYAPWDRQTNGFGNYVRANEDQRAQWGTVVDLFLAEQFTEAQDSIAVFDFPYEIVQFNDTDTGRTYYILRELLNMDYFDDNGHPDNPEIHQHGSFDYGWGIYIVNPSSIVPVVINVVHPKDDFIAPPIAVQAFQKWDARYLMIAGAGREVLWSGGIFFNNSSLSDPSRDNNHVFNVAYKAFADEIRNTFNCRELSVQIHSFDRTHMGYKSLQVSATSHTYPLLPIRDLSANHLDLINATPYIVIPENTIGMHSDILVTDYYSVYYSLHGMYYYHEGEQIPISNNINLPGVGGYPRHYSMAGWSQYDVFTPFFHIEMEELPSAYPQNEYYYKWFYGYNSFAERWDSNNFFDRAIIYYTPWLTAMAQVLPAVFELDDQSPPTEPEDFRVVSSGTQTAELEWQRSSDYDFKSYEILYSTSSIDLIEPNYSIISRNGVPIMATQALESYTITNLQPETQYYFRIRAKDYNGNYSEISNETTRYTGMVYINSFEAYGRDGFVEINWMTTFQENNAGFAIYRREEGAENYILLDDWLSDTTLAGSDEEGDVTYQYYDLTAENNILYYYRLSTNDISGNEYFYDVPATAAASEIYTLTIQNQTGTISDTVEFGSNLFATDGYDSNFDILKGGFPNENYIRAMSYKISWPSSSRYLQRDIYSEYDPENELKTWLVIVRTDQLHESLSIAISDNFSRNSEKLYLKDHTTGNYIDLTQSPLFYEAEDTEFRYFTLFWGNLYPAVTFAHHDNIFLQAGDVMIFEWTTDNRFLVDSFDIHLETETDSLYISANLSSNSTSSFWIVPDNYYLLDARLVITTVNIDGSRLSYYSPYRLGVIPSIIEFSNPSGWHMVANPFVTPVLNSAEIFGAGSSLFLYDGIDDNYIESPLFDFGQGYIVEMPVEHTTAVHGVIRREEVDIPLVQGWNLIPNVFLCDIDLENLRFRQGPVNYSFRHALQYNLIDRGFFSLDEGGYRLSQHLAAGESAWLYSYIPNLVLRIIPFYQSDSQNLNIPYDWQVLIRVSGQDFLRDEILLGSAPLTDDGYDFLYDLPKPPPRPESNSYFYLTSNSSTHHFTKLHSYFKSDLDNENVDTRIWDFVLEINPDFHPLHFSREGFNLPHDYYVLLIIDNDPVILNEGYNYIYLPTSEIIYGQIIVTNDDSNIVEELPLATVLYSNYPNPFFIGSSSRSNNGTNIAFYLEKGGEVKLEIFNIKGQKVITLLDESREAGRHTIFWNGKDYRNRTVASGIYLYRLSTGDGKSHAEKMMLLK